MRLHVQKQEYQSGLRWICSMQNKMLLTGPSGRAVKVTTGILNSRESTGDWQNTKPSRWICLVSVPVKRHMEYKWRLHSDPWYHQLLLYSVILKPKYYLIFLFITSCLRCVAEEMSHMRTWCKLGCMADTHPHAPAAYVFWQSVSSQQSQSSPLKYTGRHFFVCFSSLLSVRSSDSHSSGS